MSEINEKKSYTEYTVSSPTSEFPIGFEFTENVDNLHVHVNNSPAEAEGYVAVLKNQSTMELTPPVDSGVVRISRETNIDAPLYVFTAGALFEARTMDANFKQVMHSQQEVKDGFSKLYNDVNPLVTGLEEALQAADDAANAAQDAANAAQDAANAAEDAAINVQFKVNTVNTILDLASLPKVDGISAYVVDPNQASHFIYDSSLAATNDGVLVFNGWVRVVEAGVYKPEWAGVIADGNTDNTTSYTKLINAVPSGSIIEFKPNSVYKGGFVSNKSLVLRVNGSVLNPNTLGDCIAFESTATSVSLVGTELTRGSLGCTLVGTFTVPRGAILSIWGGDIRDASNPVNYEVVRVASSAVSGGNTVLTFDKPTAGYKSGLLTGKLYLAPLTARVLNAKIVNTNTGNYIRNLRFRGNYQPFLDDVCTSGSLGHAVSFEDCYNPQGGTIRCESPQGVGSGEGYGVVAWKSSFVAIANVIGLGMRHALDFSSTHHAVVNYVEDMDAKGVVAMLAHNGFGSNIHIGHINGYTGVSGSHGVNTNSQGYRDSGGGVNNAKRLANPVYNIHVGSITMQVKSNLTCESNVRCVSFETELGSKCYVGDCTLLFDNITTPTSAAQSNAIYVNGQCDNLSIGNIVSNVSGFGMRITNEGTSTKLGNLTIRSISLGTSNYGMFIRGYNVDVLGYYTYDRIIRGYLAEVTSVVGVPNPLRFSVRDAVQRTNALANIASVFNNTVTLSSGSVRTSNQYTSSAIPVTTSTGITNLDISRRGYQDALILVDAGAGGAGTVVTIPSLPAPAYTNGQVIYLSNSNAGNTSRATIVIPAGTTSSSDITILGGSQVRLTSVGGLWRLN